MSSKHKSKHKSKSKTKTKPIAEEPILQSAEEISPKDKKQEANKQGASKQEATILGTTADVNTDVEPKLNLATNNFERFFTKSFLLNQGSIIFKSLIKTSAYYLLNLAAQLFVFGGGLGLVWVLSHLEPKGDLARYLLPLTILAMPVAVISQNESWLDRLLNTVFAFAFLGFFTWSCTWYFQYPDWGYEAKWIAIEGLVLCCLLYFSFKKSLHNIRGPQKSLFRRFWLFGIFISLSSLSFLGYYIGTQSAPEPSTSNILSGGAFVLFLSIMIIRVYWLDGFRIRRANRAEYTHPLDHIILFEWIVPKSFNFTMMLGMLLVAQSMMFSTIYRAYQHQDKVRASKEIIPAQEMHHIESQAISLESNPNINYYSSVESTLNPQIIGESSTQQNQLYSSFTKPIPSPNNELGSAEKLSKVRPNISLSSWMLFSFKPYVFPKDQQGREVDAPLWFKYLGRALIGLIIAILLTKQLNIWKQIMASYWRLLGATRTEKHRGASEVLTRQQDEMLDQITGIFNHYSLPWRWLLLYAVSAPTLSLKWRVILDPASAYFMGIERLNDWVTQRWHAAIAISAFVIALTTLPFCYFHQEYLPHFLTSFIPTMSSALLIAFLRIGLSLRPPNSYQWWIWWLLIFHTVISILNFFLSINIGTDQSFWTQALWYTDLITIFAYPAIYLMGTDRYTSNVRPDRRISVHDDDCDVIVRRRLLIAFSDTEHRQWLVNQLTQRLHPVRSNVLHLRLITPSLALEGLERLRGLMVTLREFLTPIFGNYKRALRSWTILVFVAWLSTLTFHLFINHKMLPWHVTSAYLVDLAIIIMPAFILWLGSNFTKGQNETSPVSKSWLILNFVGLVTLSALAFKLWFKPFIEIESLLTLPKVPRDYRAWLIWLSPPTLALWQLLITDLKKGMLKRSMNQAEDLSSPETLDSDSPNERFSILRKIESFLQNLEEQLVSSVYQKTTQKRLFEFRYQSTMILNLAKIIEHSFERLRNGEWFHEEKHALSRVKSELLSKTHAQADHKLEVIEELSETLEDALDTLGSLLHDLTLTTHLLSPTDGTDEKSLELPPNPKLSVIIEALCQIAKYPLPKIESNQTIGLTPSLITNQYSALTRLHECHEEVIALVSYLTKQAYQESSVNQEFNIMISDQDRAGLLKLWCLLEAQSVDHLDHAHVEDMHPQSSKDQDLPPALQFIYQMITKQNHLVETKAHTDQWQKVLWATLHHPTGQILIYKLSHDSLNDPELERSLESLLALNCLPTPIATLLKKLEDVQHKYSAIEQTWEEHHHERVEAERSTGEIQQLKSSSLEIFESHSHSSKILRSIQYPRQLELIEREFKTQQYLDKLNHQRYEALSAVYFGTFAYLICLLKDISLNAQVQKLSWESAVTLAESLAVLEHINQDDHADQTVNLIKLILELFTVDQAEFIEQNCRDRRSWTELKEKVNQLCIELRKKIDRHSDFPIYVWGRKQKNIEPFPPSRSLVMQGLYPRFGELEKVEDAPSLSMQAMSKTVLEQHTQSTDKATKILHLGRGLRLADTKRASQIDYYSALWLLNLLHSLVNSDDLLRSPKELPQKLEQLNTLLTRIGKILKPFAGEEQIIIERLFDKAFRRLFALKAMGVEGHDILGGKGTVDFKSGFKKAEDYINGLEAKREREFNALSWLSLPPDLEFSFLLNIDYLSEGELRTYLSLQAIPQVVFKGH